MSTPEIVIPDELIPLDKSLLIRHTFLDLIRDEDLTGPIFEEYELNEDNQAVGELKKGWWTEKEQTAGESATVYRFGDWTAVEMGLTKTITKKGTLVDRPIIPAINLQGLSQKELIERTNTSQHASVFALNGDRERRPDAPRKLQETYDVIDDRESGNATSESIAVRDATIRRQAAVYIARLLGQRPDFDIEKCHSEDACFGIALGYITPEEAGKRWPSLSGHESNRIVEMPLVMQALKEGRKIPSLDHRAVQAGVMAARLEGKEVDADHSLAINKSWPEFWDFINYTDENYRQK